MSAHPHAMGPPTQTLLSESSYNKHEPARVANSLQNMSLDTSQPRGSPPPGFTMQPAGGRATSHSPSGSPPPDVSRPKAHTAPPEPHHTRAANMALNVPPRHSPPPHAPQPASHTAPNPAPNDGLSRDQRMPSMSSPPALDQPGDGSTSDDHRVLIPCENAEEKRRFQDILYTHRKYLEEMADCKYQIGPPDRGPDGQGAENLLYIVITFSQTASGRDYLRSMVETKEQLLEIPKMDNGGAAGTVTEGDRGGYNRRHGGGGYPGYREYEGRGAGRTRFSRPVKEGEEKKIIQVPSSAVGLVIGTRGTTINMIRGQTGADVQVKDDDRPDGQSGYYRNVELTGRPDQIEQADMEIQRIVRSRRSGPRYGHRGPRFDRPGGFNHNRPPPRFNGPRGPPHHGFRGNGHHHFNGPPAHHNREPYRVSYAQPPPAMHNRPAYNHGHGPAPHPPGPVMYSNVPIHNPVMAYPQPQAFPNDPNSGPRASPTPVMMLDAHGQPIHAAGPAYPAAPGFHPPAPIGAHAVGAPAYAHTEPAPYPPAGGFPNPSPPMAPIPAPGQQHGNPVPFQLQMAPPHEPQPHDLNAPPQEGFQGYPPPAHGAMPDANFHPQGPHPHAHPHGAHAVPAAHHPAAHHPAAHHPAAQHAAAYGQAYSSGAPEVGYGPVVWGLPHQPHMGDYYNSHGAVGPVDQQTDGLGMNPYAQTFQPGADPRLQDPQHAHLAPAYQPNTAGGSEHSTINVASPPPRIHGIKPFSPHAQAFHPTNTSDG